MLDDSSCSSFCQLLFRSILWTVNSHLFYYNNLIEIQMEQVPSLQQQLLDAGVHFGHLRKKWNPKMLPFIFAEKKGIHIIDLNKTVDHLQEAAAAMKQIAKSGKKIMFVATKKQAKEIVSECAN